MKFIQFCYLITLLFTLSITLFSDIKGNGTIKFDSNFDNQPEATLNSIGLGIGITPSANLHIHGNAIITETLSIGASSQSANLSLSGTLGFSIQSNDNITTTNSMVLLSSTSDNVTYRLPDPQTVPGRIYQFKKTNSENNVWITTSSNYIDGNRLIELSSTDSNFPSAQVISDGHEWYLLDSSSGIGSIASDNLKAWWKLDETSGATSEDSSSKNNEVTVDSISSMGNIGPVERSFYFDGSNDYLTAGNSNSLNLSQTISLALWVYGDSSSSAWATIIKKQTGTDGFFLQRRDALNTGHFRVDTDAGFNQRKQSNADIYDDSWHHVCVILDHGSFTWYIDGELDQQGSYTEGSGFGSSADYYIGNDTSTRYHKGYIDDIRVYNRVLNAGEVKALFQFGNF